MNLAMKVSAEVANIQGKLIDVQHQTLTGQQDNLELRSRLEKYRRFRHHHSVMWRVNEDLTEDGPFCPPCNAEGLDTRLGLATHVDQTRHYWVLYCPRGHVDQRAKPQGWNPAKQEPIYRLPKTLLDENYFFIQ